MILKILIKVRTFFSNLMFDKSKVSPKHQNNSISTSDYNPNSEIYNSHDKDTSDANYSSKIIDESRDSYNVSLWDEKDYYIDDLDN